MKIRIKLIISNIFVILLFYENPVYAYPYQTTAPSTIPTIDCSAYGANMNTLISNLKENQKTTVTDEDTIFAQINQIFTSLNSPKYNTAKLSLDLTSFQSLLTKENTDFNTLITDLTKTENDKCSNLNTYLNDVINDINQAKLIQTDLETAKKFYTAALRVDLVNLAVQTQNGE